MRDDSFFSLRPEAYTGVQKRHNATGWWKKRSRHLPARRVRSQIRKISAAINRSFVATRRPSLLRDDTRKSVAKRLL